MKMFKLNLKLLHILISLHMVISIKHNLPLILIKPQTGGFLHPTQIIIEIPGTNGGLLQGTVFNSLIPGDQAFYCKDESVLLIDYDQYCSYPKTFQPSKILECVNEPTPYVDIARLEFPSTDEIHDELCGPIGDQAKMYKFGYKICATKEQLVAGAIPPDNFEVYRFCYSESQNKVIYTEHILMSPKLLFDESLDDERQDNYEIFAKGYSHFGNFFETVREKLSNLNEPRLHLQSLVPTDDMALALWRKPTFHIANYTTMASHLVEIWTRINELIRTEAHGKQREFRIYTGAFSEPSDNPERKTKESIDTPDVWIKIIRFYEKDPTMQDSENAASSAIILNNNLTEYSFKILFRENCEFNFCQNAFPLFSEENKYVRCCMVRNNFILDFFGLEEFFMNDSFLQLDWFDKYILNRLKT